MIVHRPTNNAPQGNEGIVIETLAARMKKATGEIHNTVESRPFMKDLLNGKITKEQYGQYLINLKCIYNALEKGLKFNHLISYIDPLHIPELFRSEAIENDLVFFDTENMFPNEEALSHASVIEFNSMYNPHLLIAHAYTRYLGDVFGGQHIYPAVADSFGEESTKFYQFNELLDKYSFERPGAFGAHYRELLNKLPLTPQEKDEIVVEAISAFELTDKMLLNS
ncbi:MAG TPA: biliverdin-producing heme oxygenase [Parachlamydiaceae bacterium]|nr:biliverdin-producing heme oxygenase [Parachlamydiaceae bacterium]